MDATQQLNVLIDLAESMDIEVRFVSLGDQLGGICRLKNKWLLCINEELSIQEQVTLVAEALSDRPGIEEKYIVPEVRNLLEKHKNSSES